LQMVTLAELDEREHLKQVERISIQRAQFIIHGPESAVRRSLFDL
jgi:hypothetical protein